MTIFDIAFDYTMQFEVGQAKDGGYTNDPMDSGGETKWGISKKAHPEIIIKDLTLEKAKTIYALGYWGAINGNRIADIQPLTAIKLFDMAVNVGTQRAKRCFQQALNELGAAIEEDGWIGNATLAALQKTSESDVLALLVKKLTDFYVSLDNPRFLKGWLRRAQTLPQQEMLDAVFTG